MHTSSTQMFFNNQYLMLNHSLHCSTALHSPSQSTVTESKLYVFQKYTAYISNLSKEWLQNIGHHKFKSLTESESFVFENYKSYTSLMRQLLKESLQKYWTPLVEIICQNCSKNPRFNEYNGSIYFLFNRSLYYLYQNIYSCKSRMPYISEINCMASDLGNETTNNFKFWKGN